MVRIAAVFRTHIRVFDGEVVRVNDTLRLGTPKKSPINQFNPLLSSLRVANKKKYAPINVGS